MSISRFILGGELSLSTSCFICGRGGEMSESTSFLMVFRGGELSLSRLLKIMKKDNKVRITFNHRAYKAQNIDNPLKTSS